MREEEWRGTSLLPQSTPPAHSEVGLLSLYPPPFLPRSLSLLGASLPLLLVLLGNRSTPGKLRKEGKQVGKGREREALRCLHGVDRRSEGREKQKSLSSLPLK